MSESDLNTYRLQLQQVEAALTIDPENNELLTLKNDLEQVISLTVDLIANTLGQARVKVEEDDSEIKNEPIKKAKKSRTRWQEADPILPVKPWQVGEACQAIYTKDGQYHEATIDEITTDGEVSVTFKGYKGTYVTTLGLLKLPESGVTTVHAATGKAKRELASKQKEYLKEKKRKKIEKLQEMEAAREKEKQKWQHFSNKAFGKKGFVKKSIFKTPLNDAGRVGVGTCGISGQEMTDFKQAAKYRKGQ